MGLENVLMFFIPDILGINIQDWALSFGVFFKSLIMTLIVYINIKFLKLENSDNKIIIPLGCMSYLLIFIMLKQFLFIDFIIYEGFFRFIIPVLLLEIFFYNLYKMVVKSENNIKTVCVTGFLTAASSPVAMVISLSVFFMSCLLKLKEHKKYFILTGIFLLLGIYTLISNDGFHSHFENKIKDNIITIDYIIELFPEFIKYYFEKIIFNFGFYYLLIIMLILINLKKKIDICKVIFPLFIIIGINIFLFSLIILGKTSFDQTFWITHRDIYSIIIPLYILSLIMLTGNSIINCSEINRKRILAVFVIICIILLPLFYKSGMYLHNSLLSIKNHSYMRDKIRLFYIYKNENANMPEFSKFNSFFNLIKETETEIGQNEINNSFLDNHYEKLEKNYFINVYKLYKYDLKNANVMESDKKALEIFLHKGGNIDEVYKGKYKFSKLKEKDFVLNNYQK